MFYCIKTGFYARLHTGGFLYGDAYGMPGTDWPNETIENPLSYLLLRVNSFSKEKPVRVHIELTGWSEWFDEYKGEVVSPAPNLGIVWTPCSTLIASPGQWSWLGYDGEEP